MLKTGIVLLLLRSVALVSEGMHLGFVGHGLTFTFEPNQNHASLNLRAGSNMGTMYGTSMISRHKLIFSAALATKSHRPSKWLC